jgi:hypothetical protein
MKKSSEEKCSGNQQTHDVAHKTRKDEEQKEKTTGSLTGESARLPVEFT